MITPAFGWIELLRSNEEQNVVPYEFSARLLCVQRVFEVSGDLIGLARHVIESRQQPVILRQQLVPVTQFLEQFDGLCAISRRRSRGKDGRAGPHVGRMPIGVLDIQHVHGLLHGSGVRRSGQGESQLLACPVDIGPRRTRRGFENPLQKRNRSRQVALSEMNLTESLKTGQIVRPDLQNPLKGCLRIIPVTEQRVSPADFLWVQFLCLSLE